MNGRIEYLERVSGDEKAALLEFFYDRAFPEPNSGCWFWVGPSKTRRKDGCQDRKSVV